VYDRGLETARIEGIKDLKEEKYSYLMKYV
jgi:hypothetical protein